MADKPNEEGIETTEGRIARLSEKIRTMSLERSLQIMVAAGLATEESARAALAREARAKKSSAKPRRGNGDL